MGTAGVVVCVICAVISLGACFFTTHILGKMGEECGRIAKLLEKR